MYCLLNVVVYFLNLNKVSPFSNNVTPMTETTYLSALIAPLLTTLKAFFFFKRCAQDQLS